MKKKILLIALLILSLVGCSKIKEYKGTPIDKLSFKSTDYMGGMYTTYGFDFNENTINRIKYGPTPGLEEYKTETILFKTFTDEEEKILIDKLYTCGLFKLKDEYKPNDLIIDGGGWVLTIEYSDGSVKTSIGDNAYPEKIFAKAANAFREICGTGIVWEPYYYR